jgi:signal transduction histidine kinase/ligand-binding sensor domain-containing protein/DNA-binding response OmpR family regulator
LIGFESRVQYQNCLNMGTCRYFVSLILLLYFQQLFATDNPRIIRLGVERGLSNNSIRCIYQDIDGFLWVGTYDGLNRYDGYTFKTFRNKLNDSFSLPHNYIYSIGQDLQKNLWVGTGQGLCVYNNLSSKFSPAYFFPYGSGRREKITAHVDGVVCDKMGNLFIATNGRGLLVQFAETNTAIQVPLKIGKDNKLGYSVTSEIDEKGRVWLLVSGMGLFRYDYASKQILFVNDSVKFFHNLVADKEDNLWIGTANGLYKYSIAANSYVKTYTSQSGELTSNNVGSLAFDKKDNLWIGTEGGGVNVLNPRSGSIEYILPGENSQSLSSESISAIYHDNESRHWLGTLKGGINILDPQISQFQTVSHDPLNLNSLVNNFAATFFEDANSNLYIGTDGGGMSIWNRKTNNFQHFRHSASSPGTLSSNKVTSIIEDHRKNIWIATFGGSVNKFNRATGSFEIFRCINAVTGIENKNVWRLFQDSENTLWATTFGNGKLYRFNYELNQFEMFSQTLYDLISFIEDRNGVLWAGNSHQLIKIDRKNERHGFFEMGKPVRAIFEDKNENLWVGTEGGGIILFNRSTGKIESQYSDADGLCNNSVLNILEDGKDNLWLSTFNGLSRFNPSKKSFTNFYQSDGLQGNQFLYSSAIRLRSGELAFGGINGFTLFSPENIFPRSYMPPVFITGLRVNNSFVSENSRYINSVSGNYINSLRIPYDDAVLSVDFAALEYSSPSKITYGYFLEGWEKNWNYTQNLRTANYTNLREGKYTLHIKSTNAEGAWNDRETILKIEVLPPWFRSWWAYLVYVCLGGGLLYLYLRYKTRQTRLEYQVEILRLNEENERAERETSQALLGMEKAERERSEAELALAKAEKAKGEVQLEAQRIIIEKERELSDKKATFFSSISHEFRTPLTLVLNPVKDLLVKKQGSVEAEGELKLIYHNARRMLSLVDQLLLFQKAESGMDRLRISRIDLNVLVKDVYLSFTQMAKSKKINYQLDLAEPGLYIYADREKLEIIFYNLLSNAFKYTPEGGNIHFHVSYGHNDTTIEIQDSGTGIAREAREKLFDKFYQADRAKTGFGIGLFLVKHFVEAHKGDLSFTSEPGKGTSFSVRLPFGLEHLDEDVIDEPQGESRLLNELIEDTDELEMADSNTEKAAASLTSDGRSILVVDDNAQIRQFVARVFKNQFTVYEGRSGEEGLEMARQYQPDVIISDVVMDGMTGIELCKIIKGDTTLGHIPVILLTGNSFSDARLRGVEGGADDFITKPFEKDLLIARVTALLKSRNNLQRYFYNEITLQQNPLKISAEYKEFLDNCIAIVEKHIDDDQFSIMILARELGMSYSKMNKKIKAVSGQPANAFVRFIRLRKAAELFINTNYNISETAFQVGINDIKHFREHFTKLFGMKPSQYIDKFRKHLGKQYSLNEKIVKRNIPD